MEEAASQVKNEDENSIFKELKEQEQRRPTTVNDQRR